MRACGRSSAERPPRPRFPSRTLRRIGKRDGLHGCAAAAKAAATFRQKSAPMTASPYDTDLDRNPANFQPLSPLPFLERAASVFPERNAVIHGPLRRNYAELYARTRRLASALAKHGIGKNDTV